MIPSEVRRASIDAIRRLPRPLSISFSGGRSSGVLLRLTLDAFGGELPDDVVALFANTGKERWETLDFVHEIGWRWNVPIVWLEWDIEGTDAQEVRVVNHNSASRDGEPFERLIELRQMLPNPITRFCTNVLKVRTMARYCRDALGWRKWHVALGYRADEPARIAKLKSCGPSVWQLAFNEEFGDEKPIGAREKAGRDGHSTVAPLATGGVHRYHVADFWRESEFDLRLPITPKGTTPAGNCDLCFLKAAKTVAGLIREDPRRADWWARQETRGLHAKTADAALFRKDRPSYAEMRKMVLAQADIEERWDLSSIDCACTD